MGGTKCLFTLRQRSLFPRLLPHMAAPLLYQVLYVSTLHVEQPLSVVANIAHRARAANAERNITAMLVFDGQQFCQLLEGDRRPLLSLADRIYSDPRHQNVEVLYHGALEARRFDNFRLAFTNGEDDMSFANYASMDGKTALASFENLLLRLPV